MLQNEQYSACLSKRGLASRRSHICFARLGLPSWTLGKKNTSLFCAALPLTSCFWRMCGKPRLAFCALAHMALSLSSLLLSSPAAAASPANPRFSPPSPFVHPPKPAVQGSDAVGYRHASQEVPSQSTKLRRERVCVCLQKRMKCRKRQRPLSVCI